MLGVQPSGNQVNAIYVPTFPIPLIQSIDFLASPCNVGTNIISYSVTDQYGCSDTATMEIIVTDNPVGALDPIDDVNSATITSHL